MGGWIRVGVAGGMGRGDLGGDRGGMGGGIWGIGFWGGGI